MVQNLRISRLDHSCVDVCDPLSQLRFGEELATWTSKSGAWQELHSYLPRTWNCHHLDHPQVHFVIVTWTLLLKLIHNDLRLDPLYLENIRNIASAVEQTSIMSFYELNLAALVTVNAFLLYRQYRVQEPVETLLGDAESREKHRKDARRFAWTFFPVYALAVAADWLQASRLLFGHRVHC